MKRHVFGGVYIKPANPYSNSYPKSAYSEWGDKWIAAGYIVEVEFVHDNRSPSGLEVVFYPSDEFNGKEIIDALGLDIVIDDFVYEYARFVFLKASLQKVGIVQRNNQKAIKCFFEYEYFREYTTLKERWEKKV